MSLEKKSAPMKIIGLFTMLAGLLALAAPVTAQEAPTEGLRCRQFDTPPTASVIIPGDHPLVVLLLEDGSQVSFTDVRDGEGLSTPTDSLIVSIFKCDVADGAVDSDATTITPTPEVVETPEEATPEVVETPVEEATPEVVEESTPEVIEEPTPEVVEESSEEPTPEVVEETPEAAPTPAPEESTTPEVTILPAEPTGPAPEVLPSVIERENELALTGASSGWIAAMGVVLLAAGGAMVVGSNAVARRETA